MTATSSSATITVTNNATIGIYITMLQVRGQLVQETDVVAMTAQNTVSIERRRTRKMERELRWQQSVDKAQSWATWAAGYFPTPHYALDVHFESSVIGLAGELGQKIIDGFSNGTGAKYRIGKILHEVPDPAGQQVITTWKLFPCLPDSYFVLDASALDDAAAPIAPW
jgi:hypothetical protein